MAVFAGELQSIDVQMSNISKRRLSSFELMHKNESLYGYHKYVELLYVVSGNAKTYAGDGWHEIKKGDLFVIFPYELHGVFNHESDSDFQYIIIKFLPEIFSDPLLNVRSFEYILNFTSQHTRILSPSGIEKLAMIAVKNYRRSSDFSAYIKVKAAVLSICSAIFDEWEKRGEIRHAPSDTTHKNIEWVNIARNIADKSIGNIKSAEVANELHISPGYFSRIFKSVMYISFTEYCSQVKISEAKRLLKCSDMNITEISEALDYSTVSNFSKEFRKNTGMTPKAYRSM